MDLATLVRWILQRARPIGGIEKGALVQGNDADLVFDPDATFTVTSEQLFDRNKVTPYLGRTLRGVVRGTYVRGSHVFDGTKCAVTKIGQWTRK